MMSSTRRTVGELPAGHRDGEIEARLGCRVLERLVMETRVDEDRRTDPEHDRGERHEEDQRTGKSSPDPPRPVHPASYRAAL